jgi:hypothetical protein
MTRSTVSTRFLVLVAAGLAVVGAPEIASGPTRPPTTVVPVAAPAGPLSPATASR